MTTTNTATAPRKKAVTKQYVLLKHTEAPASNVFYRPNQHQRIPLKKRRFDSPYMQIAFTDESGESKIIRYKRGCPSIDFYEQIDKYKIPANAKFTTQEYDDVRFRNGIKSTNNETLQKFFESHPQFEGFKGTCEEVKQKLFGILDEKTEILLANKEFRKRAKAANKILEMSLKDAQDLLIRINGAYFKPPAEIDECQNKLVEILDNATDEVVDKIIGENEVPIDDQITVLISRAINGGILSFEQEKDWVVRVEGDKTVKLKKIPSSYRPDERKRFFAEFLISDEGKLLKDDLEKLITTKT